MKKGSKICHITCLDGSVHHTFITEAERKGLNANILKLSISGRKIGLLHSIDETHLEEIADAMELKVPEVF